MKRLILALVAVALFVGVVGEARATGFSPFGLRAAARRAAIRRAIRREELREEARLRAAIRRERLREQLRRERLGLDY